MFQRMLILLDGSELAEEVFIHAKELAGRMELDMVLLHVYSPATRDFVPMHQAYIDRAARVIRRQAQEVQKKLGIQPEAKPVKVRGELAMGYHADEILRYADENAVDLILMATHGRSGIKRWVLGGVADKVLRASKVPVCLVRVGIKKETPYDQWPSMTILVPLDASETTEAVLPYVKALAQQKRAEPVNVVLFKICEPTIMPSYYSPELSGTPLNWGEYMEQETARCKKTSTEYLAGIAKQLKAKGVRIRSEILVGKAADMIVDFAKKNPLSIIIMSTHGRSGLKRFVYGSITESVLAEVTNPILMVKSSRKDSTENTK